MKKQKKKQCMMREIKDGILEAAITEILWQLLTFVPRMIIRMIRAIW